MIKNDFFYIENDNYDEYAEAAIPFYKQMHDEICILIEKTDANLKILDLGCGTGKTSEVILRHLPGARIIAIDLFGEMLNHARVRLEFYKDRVEFIEGDFRTVDFGEDYDICVSAFATHHLNSDEKKQLFMKISSALKPKGVFILIDWTNFASKYVEAISTIVAEKNVRSTIENKEVINDWIDHWQNKNIPDTVEDIQNWLSKAGFTSDECIFRYYGVAMIYSQK